MKPLKVFTITLAVILAVGAIALIAGTAIKKHNSAEGGSDSATSADSTSGEGSSKSKRTSTANPITKAIVSEAIDSYVAGSDDKTQELYDSMSEEDKEIVKDIIAENVSLGSVSDVTGLIANGDKEALITYAQENIPEDDQEELKDILSKYIEP